MKENARIKDHEQINKILNETTYGTLALSAYNMPYSVPINFVYLDGNIYFHSKQTGKKQEMLAHHPHISMSIVDDLGVIPSNFSGSNVACGASNFFQSLIIDGSVQKIEDIDKKVYILNALMKKYQPQGDYIPIENNDMYSKMLNATSILELKIENISAKYKVAQNKSQEIQKNILTNLKKIDHPNYEKIKKLMVL